jgi:phage shock protein PspC (stress-responsive transcriptional regulator)
MKSPAERAQLQEGAKSWDKVIVRLAAVYLPMASWIVAGLDERWGWQPEVAPAVQVIALLVTLVGYGIVVWAMGVNAYFSTTVRLQEERGHKVVTDGLYRMSARRCSPERAVAAGICEGCDSGAVVGGLLRRADRFGRSDAARRTGRVSRICRHCAVQTITRYLVEM